MMELERTSECKWKARLAFAQASILMVSTVFLEISEPLLLLLEELDKIMD